jgi:hypothetical protein
MEAAHTHLAGNSIQIGRLSGVLQSAARGRNKRRPFVRNAGTIGIASFAWPETCSSSSFSTQVKSYIFSQW